MEHHDLVLTELLEERLMMNVALLWVMFAHALIAAPKLALGRLAPLGHWPPTARQCATAGDVGASR